MSDTFTKILQNFTIAGDKRCQALLHETRIDRAYKRTYDELRFKHAIGEGGGHNAN